MMRSFSFVHASEEDFVDGMATYGRATEPLVPRVEPPPAPDSPPALSFSFRNQVPEIPREAGPSGEGIAGSVYYGGQARARSRGNRGSDGRLKMSKADRLWSPSRRSFRSRTTTGS
jgi:hypothetical protein